MKKGPMYLAAAGVGIPWAVATMISMSAPEPAQVEPIAESPEELTLTLSSQGTPPAFDIPAPAPIATPTASIPVTDRRTEVQMAPGFYPECFSELRSERRAARRAFDRRHTETMIIRRNGGPPNLLAVTRLVLGRIILSEANWPHDERLDRNHPEQNRAEVDAGPIYQVLRYTRRDGETLLGAMRRHSPHMSETRPVSQSARSRMRWTVEMQLSCRRPPHFPERDAAGNPINWDSDYAPRCAALFALAQRLLDGDVAALGGWSRAPIITWGGRCEDVEGACDDHLAVDRGLVPFDTGETANRFWCRPGTEGCVGEPLVLADMN